jgi:hypothetical protein
LGLIEIDLLRYDWEMAISDYGACKSFIRSDINHLVRSWLGCLALILAGDVVDDEDCIFLDDPLIRLEKRHWCVAEIENLFVNLAQQGFSYERLELGKRIHEKFLNHFDEPPMGCTG